MDFLTSIKREHKPSQNMIALFTEDPMEFFIPDWNLSSCFYQGLCSDLFSLSVTTNQDIGICEIIPFLHS